MAITGPASDPTLKKKKNQATGPALSAPTTTPYVRVNEQSRPEAAGPGTAQIGMVTPRSTPQTGPSAVPAKAAMGNVAESVQGILNSMASGRASASGSRTEFAPSARTGNYAAMLDRAEGNAPEAYERPDFAPSALTRDYLARMQALEGEEPEDFSYDPFRISDRTQGYRDKQAELEGQEPGKFQSRYEGAIQSILDGILQNRQYNLKDDVNYNMLYDQARERYMNAGQKAMRDTMGAMQAATGGYGSTAATAAAGQAYDNYMSGLNDNNAQLAQMAYQMWQDQQADRYNRLGAVQGLDESDYARWAQDYNHWLQNRGYYADQSQQGYADDRSAYESDRAMDYNIWAQDYQNWMNNRNYMADQYQRMYGNDRAAYEYDTSMDYQQARDAYGDWANDRAYLAGQYQNGLSSDMSQYQYDTNMDYARERDAVSDYDDAFSKALSLAQSGMQIPAQYASRLEPETLAMLQNLAGQAAIGRSGGSGGSGGGRRSGGGRSSKGSSSGDDYKYNGKITVTDAKDMMTTIAATEGPEAARDLAQSMLNEGAIITTTALREPVADTLKDHLKTLGISDVTPHWKQQMDLDVEEAKSKKKKGSK